MTTAFGKAGLEVAEAFAFGRGGAELTAQFHPNSAAIAAGGQGGGKTARLKWPCKSEGAIPSALVRFRNPCSGVVLFSAILQVLTYR